MSPNQPTAWDLVTLCRDRSLASAPGLARLAPRSDEQQHSFETLSSPELGAVYAFVLGVCSSLVAALLYSIASASAARLLRVVRGDGSPHELKSIKLLEAELLAMKKLMSDQAHRRALIGQMEAEYAQHELLLGRTKEEVQRLLRSIVDSCAEAVEGIPSSKIR